MRIIFFVLTISFLVFASCSSNEEPGDSSTILGFDLLNDVNGHWVGQNATAFGIFDWFAFDFRPISPSHSHSIYEGATNTNIINSIFLAEHDGALQIMARNGGWLGNQYRATYYVLDRAEDNDDGKYYRLVDAAGGEDRSYIEFRFLSDSIYFLAYKDDSGNLDKPTRHMTFRGSNRNPNYADAAEQLFDFPQEVSEVNLNNQFNNLIDPDSALFLEEEDDPFPKSDHGHLSDLAIDIARNPETQGQDLLLYISKEELVSADGSINFLSIENSVIRTISIRSDENKYVTTYLHPDDYYLTVFADFDNNGFPSSGDYTSISLQKLVDPEQLETVEIDISLFIP